jgi:hypothetical protein
MKGLAWAKGEADADTGIDSFIGQMAPPLLEETGGDSGGPEPTDRDGNVGQLSSASSLATLPCAETMLAVGLTLETDGFQRTVSGSSRAQTGYQFAADDAEPWKRAHVPPSLLERQQRCAG